MDLTNYTIYCVSARKSTDAVYIGGTKADIGVRLAKMKYRPNADGVSELLGFDDVKIQYVRHLLCENKSERKMEKHRAIMEHVERGVPVLNRRVAKLLCDGHEVITCACGNMIQTRAITRHNATAKHLRYLSNSVSPS